MAEKLNIFNARVADPRDIKIGWISAIVTVILVLIIFFLVTYQIADPPPQDVLVNTETTLEELELKELKVETGGAGGGTPTNDPIDQPKEQVQQVLTNRKGQTTVKTGSSNKTNGNNPNNQASTSVQGNNPFGSGGSGNGNGPGNGPFGGPGDGEFGDGPSGAGDGKARTRLNDATLPSYDTDFDSKIHLKLSINANGDVFAATCIKSKSTCTDQRIINQVIAEVMRQVKFKKDPGSGTVYAFDTVQIDAK
jgi:hypothetical protein